MKTSAPSSVLTIRVPKALDRRLTAEARRQRLTRSEAARAILEEALNEPAEDPAIAARRQSILASRQGADKDTLKFIDQLADDRGWR
ncbi:MAG: ribbon-helix-helix protein, CopG family [Acidobacteria bacterium]|nr:ribbon-helix-helix protein, CopG family [Acidobacteriota bacterium]